ncbi:MAG TPA: Gfo/Idh/MocA family oxidoreductase [Clostridia bacterium]|nr:Gfo/Idh/MocA family oxidoreductase [Clostridia bacterium]
MKISLVGCGGISGAHIHAIQDNSEAQLISVADIKIERANKVAAQTGAVPYASLDAMLDAEKPDVLHICTPHYLHTSMALDALDRGIHVLIEKPCSVSLQELKALRAAQEKTGLKVGTCFQNRYNHSALHLQKLLQDEAKYGKILSARGFVTWQRGQNYYSDDWHGTLDKECGGVLINQAIHTLDMLQHVTGGIRAVTGHTSNDHLQGVIEVEDTASAVLEFVDGAGGVFYATTAYTADAPVLIEFKCEKAVFRMEGDNLYEIEEDGKITAIKSFAPKEYPGKACWGTGHVALICDFYASISEDRPFDIDAFAGGKAVEAVLAIYESAKIGKRMELA